MFHGPWSMIHGPCTILGWLVKLFIFSSVKSNWNDFISIWQLTYQFPCHKWIIEPHISKHGKWKLIQRKSTMKNWLWSKQRPPQTHSKAYQWYWCSTTRAPAESLEPPTCRYTSTIPYFQWISEIVPKIGNREMDHCSQWSSRKSPPCVCLNILFIGGAM